MIFNNRENSNGKISAARKQTDAAPDLRNGMIGKSLFRSHVY
jgi:hypothetical protein